jgi:hypothetical protein
MSSIYSDAAFRKSFEEAATPLIKWLNENGLHPHHTVIVTLTSAELLEGCLAHKTTEFIKD